VVGKTVDLVESLATNGRAANPMTSTDRTLARVRWHRQRRAGAARQALPTSLGASQEAGRFAVGIDEGHQPTPADQEPGEGGIARTAGVHSKKITFDLRGLAPGRRGMPPWRRRHVIPNRITRQEHDGVHVYDVDDFFHEVRRYG
jgi:hypothetical protein